MKTFSLGNQKVASLAALTLSLSAHGAFQYSLDDGAGSLNLAPSFACEFLWGNIFDVQPGSETIDKISVAFGTIAAPEGRPVTVYLYQMVTANDPTDAVLVATSTGLSGLPRTNTFIDYAIAPTTVHGQFFAAVSMQIPGTTAVIPARYDRDGAANSQRSWFFAADSFLTMPLGDAPFFNSMNNNFIQGTFMVRASGVPSPATGALLALLLVPRRRRIAAGAWGKVV